ncbi:MAG: response regulator transcription factor [Bacteroidales bacterium]|nr:response regulator transcription factor [Bacteroidales bacterium]
MKSYKILVVDDEEDLCEILKFNLESEGFTVDVAYSAEEAIVLKLEKYDLLLLDIMMGKMSGFRMAEKIRKERKLNVPIVFLTAKDTENDTLTGFSLGADDYISKPFSIREVIARINAVLKRAKSTGKEDKKLSVKNLELDLVKKKVSLNNKTIDFTKKEFEILQLLIENQGRIFSREELLDYVWKEDVIVVNRTVDVNIARIRKKLGEYGKALVSRSGYGYYFETGNLK